MDKKLTQEQIKEFWEGHGFQQVTKKESYDIGYYTLWENDAGYSQGKLPDIDLNNLFKYAVNWDEIETIQFSCGDDGHHCWIYTKKLIGKSLYGNGATDEDALFWALRQVKEGSDG